MKTLNYIEKREKEIIADIRFDHSIKADPYDNVARIKEVEKIGKILKKEISNFMFLGGHFVMINQKKKKELQKALAEYLIDRPFMDSNDVAEDLAEAIILTFGINNKAKQLNSNPQSKVIVFVRGGVVQDVKTQPGIKVEVRDYDTDGVHDNNIVLDDEGCKHVKIIF